MFNDDELKPLIEQMKAHGVEFDPGLSDAEIAEIERTCRFQFPPDLRAFLQLGLPLRWKQSDGGIDPRFPNWRKNPTQIMDDSREHARGMFHFDIENNDFWMEDEWGAKPQDLSEALALVDRFLETVPLLISIYRHRFLPAEPNLAGNPVLSVWQAIDTIYYGYDLPDYLSHEFIREQDYHFRELSEYRQIRFWSKIVS